VTRRGSNDGQALPHVGASEFPPCVRDATEADLPAIVAIYNATSGWHGDRRHLSVSVASRLPWFRSHTPTAGPSGGGDALAPSARGSVSAIPSRRPIIHRGDQRVRCRKPPAARLASCCCARRSPAPRPWAQDLGWTHLAHNEPSLCLFARHDFAQWGAFPGWRCSMGGAGPCDRRSPHGDVKAIPGARQSVLIKCALQTHGGRPPCPPEFQNGADSLRCRGLTRRQAQRPPDGAGPSAPCAIN